MIIMFIFIDTRCNLFWSRAKRARPACTRGIQRVATFWLTYKLEKIQLHWSYQAKTLYNSIYIYIHKKLCKKLSIGSIMESGIAVQLHLTFNIITDYQSYSVLFTIYWLTFFSLQNEERRSINLELCFGDCLIDIWASRYLFFSSVEHWNNYKMFI